MSNLRFSPKYKTLFRDSTPCRYYLLSGGRGSSKSFTISTWCGLRCNSERLRKNILYLRETLVSAHISIIPEFWEKIELLGLAPNFLQTKTEIVQKFTGSQIFFRGIRSSSKQQEANLKSVHNVATVIIDEAQETAEDEFDRINYSIRDREVQNRIVLAFNPTTDENHWIHRRFYIERGIPDDFNGIIGNTCYIHTDWRDNSANLPDDFIAEALECERNNPSKYKNIFLGMWGGEKENALWKFSMIDPFRVSAPPDNLDRIVVGIDPAVTGGKTSDETGIVVAGVKKGVNGADSHYYILEDASLRATPNEWGQTAVDLFDFYTADRVIGEVNNGGDLIETVLRGIRRNLPFEAVRATRGKLVRAEPVAALYERGLVHHAGRFGMLEEQMCDYTGGDTEKSPDRMDALVWAITRLADDCDRKASGGKMTFTF